MPEQIETQPEETEESAEPAKKPKWRPRLRELAGILGAVVVVLGAFREVRRGVFQEVRNLQLDLCLTADWYCPGQCRGVGNPVPRQDDCYLFCIAYLLDKTNETEDELLRCRSRSSPVPCPEEPLPSPTPPGPQPPAAGDQPEQPPVARDQPERPASTPTNTSVPGERVQPRPAPPRQKPDCDRGINGLRETIRSAMEGCQPPDERGSGKWRVGLSYAGGGGLTVTARETAAEISCARKIWNRLGGDRSRAGCRYKAMGTGEIQVVE